MRRFTRTIASRVAVGGLIIAGMWVTATGGAAGAIGPPDPDSARTGPAQRWIQEDTAGILATCTDLAGNPWGTSAESAAWSPGDAPPEASLQILTSAVVEQLPPPPALLSLQRVQLKPRTTIATRLAGGPRLYFVEVGSVSLFREGKGTLLSAGMGALVPKGIDFSFANNSTEPVQLFRLSIDVPDAPEDPVYNVVAETPTPVPADKLPTRSLLFRSAVKLFPPLPARLFLACASWSRSQAEPALTRHPGVVGMRMSTGRLEVKEGALLRTLPSDGCILLDPRKSYRVQAADDAAAGLLFGLVVEGQPLWLPGAENAAPAVASDLVLADCGSS